MVNEDKRQRHKDGHRSRMEEARQAQARARRSRLLLLGIGLGTIVLVLVVVIVKIGGDDGTDTAGTTTSSTTLPYQPPSETTLPAVKLPVVKGGASISGETPCPAADGSEERTTTFAKAPPTCIDPAKTYTATMKTTEGDIVIALDAEHSPIAVNNFVVLARYHFYDSTIFHRIVPGFVDQGGGIGKDLGTSGPGYDLPEEKPFRKYAKGDIAMAASSAGPSGSQFFLTIDPTSLNASPNYPLLGTITSGMDVVLRINQLGQADSQGNGAPTKVVTVKSVSIQES